MEPVLDIQDLRVDLGGATIVNGVSLSVDAGGVLALLGPSGCGKTTTLRAIAGLQEAHAGHISSAGQPLSGPRHHVPPHKRPIGLVFQEGAVFPHLDVRRNLEFGLTGVDRADRDRRVAEMVELLRLDGLEHRASHELSGGQRQRVALGRALIRRPRLMLLDEPFSSLDAALRGALRRELFAVLKATTTAALLVTHDQDEALSVADTIAVMRAGRIEQWATPGELLDRPANAWVASFVGAGALVRGVNEDGWLELGGVMSRLADPRPDGPVDVLLRPHALRLVPASDEADLRGTLLRVDSAAGLRTAVIDLDEGRGQVRALLDGMAPEPGRAVGLRLLAQALWPVDPSE